MDMRYYEVTLGAQFRLSHRLDNLAKKYPSLSWDMALNLYEESVGEILEEYDTDWILGDKNLSLGRGYQLTAKLFEEKIKEYLDSCKIKNQIHNNKLNIIELLKIVEQDSSYMLVRDDFALGIRNYEIKQITNINGHPKCLVWCDKNGIVTKDSIDYYGIKRVLLSVKALDGDWYLQKIKE